MTRDEMRQLVAAEAHKLGPALYEGLSAAIHAADTRSRGLVHATYPHLRPLITRIEAREYLSRECLPRPWVVDGNPALMGQLYLTATDLGLKLRMLKERRRTYPQGVPIAGHNTARRLAWQAPLPLDLPPASTRAAPAVTELLLLWDYAKTDGDDTSFTLRIVHPVEAGVYGRGVRCDLDLSVQTGGTIFENLTFTGDEDEENFFETEIDRDENTGGSDTHD